MIKPTREVNSVTANTIVLAGTFNPNGTSNPTVYAGHFGTSTAGAMTVTYNSATGKWLVTVNIPITKIIAVAVNEIDNAAQTVLFSVRAALSTDSAQTVEIWGASSSDMITLAATNTIDTISVILMCTTSGVT